MSTKKGIAVISDETLAIRDFIETAPLGATIPYLTIESQTGVKMNTQGKQKLRSACNSLHIEYTCIRGDGIVLMSPENADQMVSHRLIRIDNAVRRGEKTTNRAMKHINEMPEETRRKTLFAASVFGAIRASAQLAKKEYKSAIAHASRRIGLKPSR